MNNLGHETGAHIRSLVSGRWQYEPYRWKAFEVSISARDDLVNQVAQERIIPVSIREPVDISLYSIANRLTGPSKKWIHDQLLSQKYHDIWRYFSKEETLETICFTVVDIHLKGDVSRASDECLMEFLKLSKKVRPKASDYCLISQFLTQLPESMN